MGYVFQFFYENLLMLVHKASLLRAVGFRATEETFEKPQVLLLKNILNLKYFHLTGHQSGTLASAQYC